MKLSPRFVLITAALAALQSPLPASAQAVTAAQPQSIANVLRGDGYKVELKTLKDGSPYILTEVNDHKFSILFYGCTNGKSCTSIQFFAAFTDTDMTIARMNEWNSSKQFGRAYIDKDGDPAIEMDINLDDGGMSKPLFEDNVQFWEALLDMFCDFVRDVDKKGGGHGGGSDDDGDDGDGDGGDTTVTRT